MLLLALEAAAYNEEWLKRDVVLFGVTGNLITK
jgi:hypothetical protein